MLDTCRGPQRRTSLELRVVSVNGDTLHTRRAAPGDTVQGVSTVSTNCPIRVIEWTVSLTGRCLWRHGWRAPSAHREGGRQAEEHYLASAGVATIQGRDEASSMDIDSEASTSDSRPQALSRAFALQLTSPLPDSWKFSTRTAGCIEYRFLTTLVYQRLDRNDTQTGRERRVQTRNSFTVRNRHVDANIHAGTGKSSHCWKRVGLPGKGGHIECLLTPLQPAAVLGDLVPAYLEIFNDTPLCTRKVYLYLYKEIMFKDSSSSQATGGQTRCCRKRISKRYYLPKVDAYERMRRAISGPSLPIVCETSGSFQGCGIISVRFFLRLKVLWLMKAVKCDAELSLGTFRSADSSDTSVSNSSYLGGLVELVDLSGFGNKRTAAGVAAVEGRVQDREPETDAIPVNSHKHENGVAGPAKSKAPSVEQDDLFGNLDAAKYTKSPRYKSQCVNLLIPTAEAEDASWKPVVILGETGNRPKPIANIAVQSSAKSSAMTKEQTGKSAGVVHHAESEPEIHGLLNLPETKRTDAASKLLPKQKFVSERCLLQRIAQHNNLAAQSGGHKGASCMLLPSAAQQVKVRQSKRVSGETNKGEDSQDQFNNKAGISVANIQSPVVRERPKVVSSQESDLQQCWSKRQNRQKTEPPMQKAALPPNRSSSVERLKAAHTNTARWSILPRQLSSSLPGVNSDCFSLSLEGCLLNERSQLVPKYRKTLAASAGSRKSVCSSSSSEEEEEEETDEDIAWVGDSDTEKLWDSRSRAKGRSVKP